MDMATAVPSAAEALRSLDVDTVPEGDRKYTGYPWWVALNVPPTREERSAELLRCLHVFVYLPRYIAHTRAPRGRRRCVARAVVPGLVFAPTEMMAIPRREKAFDLCHVHGFVRFGGDIAILTKVDIEDLRRMEADLYVPPPPEPTKPTEPWKGKVGDPVRFRGNALSGFCWRDLVVAAIDDGQIAVEGQMLGARRTMWTTATKIEVDPVERTIGVV